MNTFIAAFFAAFGDSIVSLGFRLLAGIGVSVVVYTGVGALLDQVEAQIATGYGDLLPAGAVILDMMGFRVALSVICSAFAVKLTLMGVSAVTGSLSRTRWQPPVSGG